MSKIISPAHTLSLLLGILFAVPLQSLAVHLKTATSDLPLELFVDGSAAVATAGGSMADGSAASPFIDLAAAQAAVRKLKHNGAIGQRGVVVTIRPGVYRLREGLSLGAEDSGSAEAPVRWRAQQKGSVVLSGGIDVPFTALQWVRNPAVLARIRPEARERVMQVNLRELGIVDLPQMPLYGHSMHALEEVTQYRTGAAAMEIFVDGIALVPARWPNDDFAKIADVVERGSVPRNWQADMQGKTTSFHGGGYVPPEQRDNPPKGFSFKIDGERAKQWKSAPDAMLFGYWFWDWSDQAVGLAGVDSDGTIRSVQPAAYGLRKGQRFFVYNLLEELDDPGEWYLDHSSGILYLIPPPDASAESVLSLSLLRAPFFDLRNASHIAIENLDMVNSRGTAIAIRGGEGVRVIGCRLQFLSEFGVMVIEGKSHLITDSLIADTGTGGIDLLGGDRTSLTPAGHRAENNTIRNFSRIRRTYSAAIRLRGVGNAAVGNIISEGPHTGISFSGNDHLIEGNDISRVGLEADDMAAVYAFRDHVARGTVIRGNNIHNLSSNSSGHLGLHGVYLDYASGATIENNFFRDIMGTTIVINGGRNNTVVGNTFYNSAQTLQEAARRGNFRGRFSAVTLSDIGLDPRNPAPANMVDNQGKLNYTEAPFTKYPNLADMAEDEPSAPKYNRIENNIVIGYPEIYFHHISGKVDEAQFRAWNTIGNNYQFSTLEK